MKVSSKLPHFALHICAVLVGVLMAGHCMSSVKADSPRLDGVSPRQIDVGSTNVTVTLAGGSFAADNKVYVNDNEVTAQMSAADTISVALPNSLTTQRGILYFQVKSGDGLAATSPRVVLVVDPADRNAQSATIVISSDYDANAAPGAMVSIFGTKLATGNETAMDMDPVTPGIQLPDELAGTRVFVNGRQASLLYAGSDNGLGFGQINFIMPDDVATGQAADVIILAGDNTVTSGTVNVVTADPGIFTFDQSGTGLPIALITSDGQSFSSVANSDGTPNPVNAGTADQPTYLILFGTGWRNRTGGPTDFSSVTVTMGGKTAVAQYVGAQPDFPGLDQMNLIIPADLAGTNGDVDIVITIDGKTAKTTRITIQ